MTRKDDDVASIAGSEGMETKISWFFHPETRKGTGSTSSPRPRPRKRRDSDPSVPAWAAEDQEVVVDMPEWKRRFFTAREYGWCLWAVIPGRDLR